MYADLLREKFPQDEKNGLFRAPKLPASKLGRLLTKETRIQSPGEVVALHVFNGLLRDGYLIFTGSTCYYEKGSFPLESVREVQVKDDELTVFVAQQNEFVPHVVPVKNELVAEILQRLLSQIAAKDLAADKLVEQVYEGFDGAELDWLKLRDEVLRTIDLLYERYNEGKLSLMEYENKKSDLLSRL